MERVITRGDAKINQFQIINKEYTIPGICIYRVSIRVPVAAESTRYIFEHQRPRLSLSRRY